MLKWFISKHFYHQRKLNFIGEKKEIFKHTIKRNRFQRRKVNCTLNCRTFQNIKAIRFSCRHHHHIQARTKKTQRAYKKAAKIYSFSQAVKSSCEWSERDYTWMSKGRKKQKETFFFSSSFTLLLLIETSAWKKKESWNRTKKFLSPRVFLEWFCAMCHSFSFLYICRNPQKLPPA